MNKDYGPGWDALVLPLLALAERWHIKVTALTTNYGRLMVLWDPPEPGSDLEPGQLETFREAAIAAERLSVLICDECGRPGRLRDTFPAQTRCDAHTTGKAL